MDLRHEGWFGDLDRMAAEKLLAGAEVGVYLIRAGDDYTRILEQNLKADNSGSIHCYVLTLVEEEDKNSDKVLVHTQKGWSVFNDDLRLSEYRFESLEKLLREVRALVPFRRFKRAV